MARVLVTESAVRSLNALIESHSLPEDTPARVRRIMLPLERFPLLGPALEPASPELRFLLGPWRWLVIVYAFRPAEDLVAVLAFEDGRSAQSSTGRRQSSP